MAGGEIRPGVGGPTLELHVNDVAAGLLVQTRGGVLDLVAADDRRRQQIGRTMFLVAGHQRQGGVVVAGQDVFLVAPGGLVLQGQELHTLVGALPPLLFFGDALGEVLTRIRRPWLDRGCRRGWRRRRGRRRRILRIRPRLRRD